MKKSTPTIEDIRKVGSRMARIQSIDMFGPYAESENGQYMLIRQDSDRELGIGGYRDSGNGRFALVKKNQALYIGECERPTEGKVSNTGTFAITDTLFGNQLGSKLYVYSKDGTLLLSHLFSANTLNIGISIDGSHVAVQLCNCDTDDSGKLYLFNVNESKVISKFIPETGWADKYEFSIAENTIYLCYRNNRRYAYLFDGTFLDRVRYDRERIEDASPTDLVLIVREKLKVATQEQLPCLLSMIDKAFEGSLSDYQALAYRLKGEIHESMGNKKEALSAYQDALKIDPKIGVKQRLKKLEKESKSSCSSGPVLQLTKPTQFNPIVGTTVQQALYNFTQYAFIGGAIETEPFDIKQFPTVVSILRLGSLTQQDLAMQTLSVQRVLYELLTQYIMFLTINPDLPFPPDFLENSNAQVIGPPITAYMAEHAWPFPQMLPQR